MYFILFLYKLASDRFQCFFVRVSTCVTTVVAIVATLEINFHWKRKKELEIKMEAKKTRLQKKSSRNKKKRPTSPLVATLEKKGTPNEILKNNLLYIKIKIWRKKNLIDRRPAGKELTASRRFLRFIFFIIFFYLTNFFFWFPFRSPASRHGKPQVGTFAASKIWKYFRKKKTTKIILNPEEHRKTQ